MIQCSVSFCRYGNCYNGNNCNRKRRSTTEQRYHFVTKQNTVFNGPFYPIDISQTEKEIEESSVENN